MKCDKIYNHLNAEEYLLLRQSDSWNEILDAIRSIDANLFLKISNDDTKKGEVLYSQSDINDEFERLLFPKGWKSTKTQYYVSEKPELTKELVKIKDKDAQKAFLDARNEIALDTFNQVDFVKNGIAVEVQFGKYFSVAYDLHVKHTFFYSLGTINVGVEIIPTHEFESRMDTGVSWWENEVANVIREGRSNPSVPIVIIGIEPEELIPLPDKSSAKKVQKAQDRLNKATQAVQDAEQNVEDIQNDIATEEDEKQKSKLESKLERAERALESARETLDKANEQYNEAVEKDRILTDFKASAAPIIEDLNNKRQARKEEIKQIQQEMARRERVDENAD